MITTDYTDINVWRRIISTTLNNYINMEKRLSGSKKLSNFILVYYSIYLIISSLTSSFFAWYNKQLSEYFGIVISIIILAFSLINSNANYSKRIENITNAINSLKTIKRKLCDEDLENNISEYNAIVDQIELRSDLDFFNTIKMLCKSHNKPWYKKSKLLEDSNDEERRLFNYLSEISPYYLQLIIIVKKALSIMLTILPVLTFIACAFF